MSEEIVDAEVMVVLNYTEKPFIRSSGDVDVFVLDFDEVAARMSVKEANKLAGYIQDGNMRDAQILVSEVNYRNRS